MAINPSCRGGVDGRGHLSDCISSHFVGGRIVVDDLVEEAHRQSLLPLGGDHNDPRSSVDFSDNATVSGHQLICLTERATKTICAGLGVCMPRQIEPPNPFLG